MAAAKFDLQEVAVVEKLTLALLGFCFVSPQTICSQVSTGEESFGAKGGVASGKQKDDFVTGLEVVVLMLQHRVKVLEQMIDGHIQVYQLTVVLSWNLVALDSVNTSLE